MTQPTAGDPPNHPRRDDAAEEPPRPAPAGAPPTSALAATLGSAADRVRSAVAAIPRPPESDAARDDLYLLFSFDLANSTAYKEREPRAWPLVTARFYELVVKGMQDRVHPDVQLWKYVGDEVLLYRRVTHVSELRGAVEGAHTVLRDTIDRLHANFPRTRTILSVKGVVWAARTRQIQPELIEAASRGESPAAPLNLVFDAAPGLRGTRRDFLGPDIDQGFRLGSVARKRRLVVGANLAYLLYRDRARDDAAPGPRRPKIETVLRLVGFEALRGVWENRPYPVAWYERESDWANLAATFDYDEALQSPLVKALAENAAGTTHTLDYLDKVFADVGRQTAAEELWTFAQDLRPAADDAVAGATPSRRGPDVHCAAVCFDAQGRALVAQRPRDKRLLPSAWEFGCGQLAPGERIAAALARSYHEDFGAELDFGSEPGDPRPVTAYHIDRGDGRATPGLIFVAGVRNPRALEAKRHQAIAWVDPRDPGTWPPEPRVPEFGETLRRAAAAWRDLHDARRDTARGPAPAGGAPTGGRSDGRGQTAA